MCIFYYHTVNETKNEKDMKASLYKFALFLLHKILFWGQVWISFTDWVLLCVCKDFYTKLQKETHKITSLVVATHIFVNEKILFQHYSTTSLTNISKYECERKKEQKPINEHQPSASSSSSSEWVCVCEYICAENDIATIPESQLKQSENLFSISLMLPSFVFPHSALIKINPRFFSLFITSFAILFQWACVWLCASSMYIMILSYLRVALRLCTYT